LYLLFAWRYFKAKKSTNAINIIAWTSISAIVVGTTALILVLGVFNGFEGLVKSLYSSFYTDWKISPKTGKTIQLSPGQFAKLQQLKWVKGFSPVVEERVLLQSGENQSMVNIKGVDKSYENITGISSHIVNGSYKIGTEESPQLILGVGVEDALGIYSSKELFPLTVYLPKPSASKQLDISSDIVVDTLRTSASFMIQQDFDNKYAFTHISFLKKRMGLSENSYSSLELAAIKGADASALRKELTTIFSGNYLIQDRYEQNKSLYAIMTTERWIVYGVLSLILLVAAFNMVGALSMLVLEKQKDISIIQSFGGDASFIRKIFLSEGVLLALIGGGAGMLLASLLAWLQIRYHLIPLQGGSFLIDYYPVKLRIQDFLLVGATILVIAILASWIPSKKAASRPFNLRAE
jgi:lipoprotein-releasing system permease protein